jgi:hypothetical protein
MNNMSKKTIETYKIEKRIVENGMEIILFDSKYIHLKVLIPVAIRDVTPILDKYGDRIIKNLETFYLPSVAFQKYLIANGWIKISERGGEALFQHSEFKNDDGSITCLICPTSEEIKAYTYKMHISIEALSIINDTSIESVVEEIWKHFKENNEENGE